MKGNESSLFNYFISKNKKMISNNPVFDYKKTVENLHRK